MSARNPAPIPRLLAPELSLYRRHCIALLRRYFTMSVEAGRLPALLGREFFRTRIRSCRVFSFEDIVIFLHDVERCLERLDLFHQSLIARIVFQEYTMEEASRLLHCSLITVKRRFPEALDALTEIFLANGMLVLSTRHYRHPPREVPSSPAAHVPGGAVESAPVSHSGLEMSALVSGVTQAVKPPEAAICS